VLVVGARNLLVIREILSTDEADVPDYSDILRALVGDYSFDIFLLLQSPLPLLWVIITLS
jgi:hypothetical protein